jgi:hypothetical protein
MLEEGVIARENKPWGKVLTNPKPLKIHTIYK